MSVCLSADSALSTGLPKIGDIIPGPWLYDHREPQVYRGGFERERERERESERVRERERERRRLADISHKSMHADLATPSPHTEHPTPKSHCDFAPLPPAQSPAHPRPPESYCESAPLLFEALRSVTAAAAIFQPQSGALCINYRNPCLSDFEHACLATRCAFVRFAAALLPQVACP